MSRHTLICLALAAQTFAQSIKGLGVSGGNGSQGGIGCLDNPVLHAQSFITDALIPTAPNTTRQLALGPAPVLSTTNSSATTCTQRRNVIIDASAKGAQQEMVGFGHSWTDSTVTVFNELEPVVLDQVLDDLFGQNGNNMGFMRHTIGSSDMSGQQYSYDDNGPDFNLGEPDSRLANFDLGVHGTAMAKMLARMGDVKGDVFLFGAAMELPGVDEGLFVHVLNAHQKQALTLSSYDRQANDLFIAPNLQVPSGAYPFLNNSLNITYIPEAIEYFTRYVDAFKTYGVNVNGGYPTMYLDAADEANILLNGLGDAMHERGVINLAYDHNTDQPVYPARVKQAAGDLVDAVAWHCYQSPIANYSVLDDFEFAYPGTLQFMTECTNYLPSAGSVNFEVAQNFLPPVQHGASGAAMWVLATDEDFGPHSPYGGCAGCLGSIVVNSSTTYRRTNDYYMVGQFSRFVRRGAVNHKVLQGNEGSAATSNQFYVMAVQNPDQSWAVIFMNNYGSDQDVVLSFAGQNGTARFWEGVVPKSTVTTWLIPSEQYLASNNTTPTSAQPPYPYGNNTSVGSTGSMYATTAGSQGLTATGGACNATSMTSSSSSSSSSATVIPVPDTTHTVTYS